MNKFYLLSILILQGLLIHAQDRFASVVITETKLSDEVYMLEGSGGNIGLVLSENEALIIDDQFAPLSEKIMEKIKEIAGSKVTVVVNTHWHGDHTGGNENFGKEGAMIVAHENVRTRMSTEQVRGERVTPPSPEVAWPVITYNDEMQLYIADQPILIAHVHNAHTDGDSFVFLPESNILHMGDCFFHQRFPYIDVGSGGSVDGIIKAAEVALMMVDDETQIIPGHGPMATKADLVKYHEFLGIARNRVQSQIAQGVALADINADEMVAGYEEWSWGFINAERFVSIVHSSLSAR